MAKVKCSRGHIYDSAIYGDNCPFCPSGTIVNESGTEVNKDVHTGTQVNEENRTQTVNQGNLGQTIPMNPTPQNGDMGGPRTRFQQRDGSPMPNGKRVVAILATYDTNTLGEIYKIYEGRNYIGRDITSDICISSDSLISGKHISILFRSADNKFKFKDEHSSNGTFINNSLEDEGELNSFDIIKIGNTSLIFIAIPRIIK